MGIFFNPEKYYNKNEEFNIEIEFIGTTNKIFENNQFKVGLHNKFKTIKITVRDFEKGGRSGSASQHEPGIKISQDGKNIQAEFFIPKNIVTSFDQIKFVDDGNLLNKKTKLIKFIKNFIVDNRVYLTIFWNEYQNKEIQDKCENEINNNFNNNYELYSRSTILKKTEKDEMDMKEKIYGK